MEKPHKITRALVAIERLNATEIMKLGKLTVRKDLNVVVHIHVRMYVCFFQRISRSRIN